MDNFYHFRKLILVFGSDYWIGLLGFGPLLNKAGKAGKSHVESFSV